MMKKSVIISFLLSTILILGGCGSNPILYGSSEASIVAETSTSPSLNSEAITESTSPSSGQGKLLVTNPPSSEEPSNSSSATNVEATTIPEVNIFESDPGILKVHFIDVGQADSILIQNNAGNMLIDAGNNEDSDLVVKYLKKQGVSKLDYVIATHPHEDHIGGMDVIVGSFGIGKIIMPKAQNNTATFEDLLDAISKKGLKVTSPIPGAVFKLGIDEFAILAPNSSSYDDLNNYSVVLRLFHGKNSFLFMGDAETLSESEILSKGYELPADVIKIGHHGSDSSTSNAFLSAVHPQYAVISVGVDNSYGHPTPSTIKTLISSETKVYRTDENGTIVISSDGVTISTSFDKTQSVSDAESPISSPTIKPTPATSEKTPLPTPKPTVKPVPIPSNDVVVYTTNTGEKYHRGTCRYLSKSKIAINLSDAKSQGLVACKVCKPPQ